MWLLVFSLLLGAAGCSTTPANIGVGLPSVDPTTGAYLVDTLTLKTSTVLRDSVITSTSQYLLAGRYVDPQLGTIKVSSYTTFGLGGAFIPDRSQLADSLVLVFKPDTYRYGDTTKTQALLEVRELNAFIPLTSYGFAAPRLTPIAGNVNMATLLNETTPAPRRARSNLGSLRLRLSMPLIGNRLMTDAKNGVLTTQDNFDANYHGLALLPGANDDASIIRFDATSSDAALILYYHDPIDPTTAISHSFPFNRHFYQADATLSGQLAGIIPSVKLESAKTGEQTYIEGLLGLETKIEIPYLYDLRNYGQHFIITSAVMTAQVPANTLNRNLPPPAAISVSTTDLNNRLGATFVTSTPYSAAITSVDGIDKAGYSWSVLAYLQNALNNNIPNNGMLLNTTTPTLPERVILGSSRFASNKLQLRVYVIRND